jgi:hypothetical protein
MFFTRFLPLEASPSRLDLAACPAWAPLFLPSSDLAGSKKGILACSKGDHFEPKTEPNPNNPNYRSIQVSGFGFGLDKFIIRSSVSVLVVYNLNRTNNPKFNIVVYF